MSSSNNNHHNQKNKKKKKRKRDQDDMVVDGELKNDHEMVNDDGWFENYMIDSQRRILRLLSTTFK